jgi:cytoskeletal protein CcmA (bactofilin family)
MSYTSNNWKKIGGTNRTSNHNIVRVPQAVNNNLNITDTIGTTNSDTNMYGNLNLYGNLDISGVVTCNNIDISGTITCDTLDVNGTITCGVLDVSGTIKCGVLDVSGTITCGDLDVSGTITYGNLDVSGTITCGDLDVSGTIMTNYTTLPIIPTNAIGYNQIVTPIYNTGVTNTLIFVTSIPFVNAGIYLLMIDLYIVKPSPPSTTGYGFITVTTNTGGTSITYPWPILTNGDTQYSNCSYNTIINATTNGHNELVNVVVSSPLSLPLTITGQYKYIKIA